MTLRVRVVLSDRDRQSLQRLVKRDVDGRVRERAFSLLSHPH